MTPRGHLVLDWNGTVVDDLQRAIAATAAVVGAAAPASTADLRHQFRLPLHRFLAELGVPADQTPAAVARWSHEMASRPPVLAPGARELLRHARTTGVAVHVVSGAAGALVHADATALGLVPFLTSVTGDVHPKREAIAEYTRTGCPTVYVGDTDYDIEEGAAGGAMTVGTTYGYRPVEALKQAGASLVVDDLAQLVSVLDALLGSGQR